MGSAEGARRRARAQGARHEQLQSELRALDPTMAEWADRFVFDEVWGREGLSQDERMLVAITALAATEHPAQLRNYLHGALQAGVSARKIHEALLMMVVYAGFPATLGSLTVWKEVVESSRRHGVELDLPNDES
jgi:4-carboxymuconolactone decarboxylase